MMGSLVKSTLWYQLLASVKEIIWTPAASNNTGILLPQSLWAGTWNLSQLGPLLQGLLHLAGLSMREPHPHRET